MSTLVPNTSVAARRRASAFLVLGLLAVVAWIASVDRMDGMSMGSRFSVGSLGFFVVLWVLMMSAMMFPSVWPAVAMYGMVIRRRAASGARATWASAVFVAGYLAAWTAFGLVAFGLLALARAAGLDTLSPDEIARYGVAPVALAAAAYQLVPFKQVCLRHCRGPLSFFMEHWRDGPGGALRMGVRHGAYCVGCCWLLMLVLLALGVMSITWMVAVSLAIAVEKLAPQRWATFASGVLTLGLVVLAVVALAKPSWLPGVDGGMGGMHDGGSDMGGGAGSGGMSGDQMGGAGTGNGDMGGTDTMPPK
jgi:predicted metal-binding membrane protein